MTDGRGDSRMRRWRRKLLMGKEQERRVMLADDVRRLAGLADFAVGEARLLGAELPDNVVLCVVTWRTWAGELAQWSHERSDNR